MFPSKGFKWTGTLRPQKDPPGTGYHTAFSGEIPKEIAFFEPVTPKEIFDKSESLTDFINKIDKK